ncbi:MAG: SGNH/GDSL hydrolase family protein [Clostridia bacterium]|nr:SGNH/GDSL hydrolase family protein [Clostridia bacterium]
MNRIKRMVIPVVAFLLTAALLLFMAQCLLVPHDASANPEGALIGEFTDGFGAQDVLFLGDCEIYESFSTVTLWEEYGIDAWLCGSPQQLMWHSYAMLCQAFKVGTPSVVVLGVYGLRYGEPQNEAYNRMALDGLIKTPALAALLKDAMCQGESLLSYYFPLLRYHDRWDEVTVRDVQLLFTKQTPVSYNGYLMQCGVLPDADGVADHTGALPLTDLEFGDMAVEYFDRIVSLCREKGAQLILLKAPTDSWTYPWYEEWESATEALAKTYELPYYNLLEVADKIGLDYTTDTYDAGLHLNVYGAEKTALYFGEILQNEFDVTDRRGDAVREMIWKGTVMRYEEQKKSVD